MENNSEEAESSSAATPPYWDTLTTIVLSIIMILIMLVGLIGNTMVLVVVGRHRGMRTRTNMFLCNLAVADFLCSALVMPFSLATVLHGDWPFGDTFCQINGFTMVLFFVTSIHTLMYISIHKYISIIHPFSHALGRMKIRLMIVAAWLWGIVSAYLSVQGLNHIEYKPYTTQCGPSYPHDLRTYMHPLVTCVTCYLIPFSIMTFCYLRMFKEIKAHSKRLEEHTNQEPYTIFLQQRRVAVTLLLVLLAFVFCWTPYVLYSVLASAVTDKRSLPHIVNAVSYWCGFMNSAVNPIIYALRSPAFREGYKEIMCQGKALITSEGNVPATAIYDLLLSTEPPEGSKMERLRMFFAGPFQHQGGGAEERAKKKLSLVASYNLFRPRIRSPSTGSLPNNFMYGVRGRLSCPEVVHFNGSPSLRVNGKIIYKKPQTGTTKRNNITPLLETIKRSPDTTSKEEMTSETKTTDQITDSAEEQISTKPKISTAEAEVEKGISTHPKTYELEPCAPSDLDFSSPESDQQDDVWIPRDMNSSQYSDSDNQNQVYTSGNSSEANEHVSGMTSNVFVVAADVEPFPTAHVPAINVTTPDLINDLTSSDESNQVPEGSHNRPNVLNRSISDNTQQALTDSNKLETHSKSEADIEEKSVKPHLEEKVPLRHRLSVKRLLNRKRFSRPESSHREESVGKTRYSFAGFTRLFTKSPVKDSFLRSQSVDDERRSVQKVKERGSMTVGESKIEGKDDNTNVFSRKISRKHFERVSWSDFCKFQKGNNVEVIPQDKDTENSKMLGGVSIEHLDKLSSAFEKVKNKVCKERNCKSVHLEEKTVICDPQEFPKCNRSISDPCILTRQVSEDLENASNLTKRKWTQARKNNRQMKGKGQVCFVDLPNLSDSASSVTINSSSTETEQFTLNPEAPDKSDQVLPLPKQTQTLTADEEDIFCDLEVSVADCRPKATSYSSLHISHSSPDLMSNNNAVNISDSDVLNRSSFSWSTSDLSSIAAEELAEQTVEQANRTDTPENVDAFQIVNPDIYRVIKRRKKLDRRIRFADPLHRESFRDSIVNKSVDEDGVRETFI